MLTPAQCEQLVERSGHKVQQLRASLQELGSVLVAFSGGVDSTFVLRLAREIMTTLPRELNIIVAGLNAPPAPFVPEQHHHQPGYALVVAGFGSAGQHHQVMTRIRQALPPLVEFTTRALGLKY